MVIRAKTAFFYLSQILVMVVVVVAGTPTFA
jgi:hypothetical protein